MSVTDINKKFIYYIQHKKLQFDYLYISYCNLILKFCSLSSNTFKKRFIVKINQQVYDFNYDQKFIAYKQIDILKKHQQ